jgi:hypothetical protein
MARSPASICHCHVTTCVIRTLAAFSIDPRAIGSIVALAAAVVTIVWGP